jgi:hypothetical protein
MEKSSATARSTGWRKRWWIDIRKTIFVDRCCAVNDYGRPSLVAQSKSRGQERLRRVVGCIRIHCLPESIGAVGILAGKSSPASSRAEPFFRRSEGSRVDEKILGGAALLALR